FAAFAWRCKIPAFPGAAGRMLKKTGAACPRFRRTITMDGVVERVAPAKESEPPRAVRLPAPFSRRPEPPLADRAAFPSRPVRERRAKHARSETDDSLYVRPVQKTARGG